MNILKEIRQSFDEKSYDSSYVGAETSLQFSNILQYDGEDGQSVSSFNESDNNSQSKYEVDFNPVKPVLVPSVIQPPGVAPLQLEVYTTGKISFMYPSMCYCKPKVGLKLN